MTIVFLFIIERMKQATFRSVLLEGNLAFYQRKEDYTVKSTGECPLVNSHLSGGATEAQI